MLLSYIMYVLVHKRTQFINNLLLTTQKYLTYIQRETYSIFNMLQTFNPSSVNCFVRAYVSFDIEQIVDHKTVHIQSCN